MVAMKRRDAQLQRSSQVTVDSNAGMQRSSQGTVDSNAGMKGVSTGPSGGPADIQQVQDWKQNEDGSITGIIFNSMSFKDGSKITTSPVPKGAKAGYLVKTITGTRYLLN
jgi:hypothetical protein